ncbi:hypothetical protein QQ020_19225 [Fulvivirgaceae bacterium BMA12]|uniref:Uncharacterized protein n=1 Tax=Agaribacillus aureus TaxID=3051825 RepID=A0ABT8LD27_9BACT|nr:hypothetical protein [Fulvivirgaceae bacterium BMA12]
MQAIFIFRKLSEQEYSEVSRKTGDDNTIFFGSDAYRLSGVEDQQLLSLSAEEKKDINHQVLQEMLALSAVQIDNQIFCDYLKIGHFHPWFYHKFRVYFEIRNVAYDIERIKKVIHTFEQVQIYTDNIYIRHFFAAQRHVNITHATAGPTRSVPLKFVATVLRVSIKRLLWGLFGKHPNTAGKNLIVDTRDNHREVLDMGLQGTKCMNTYLGYLFERLSSDQFLFIDNINVPKPSRAGDRFNKFLFKKPSSAGRIFEEEILFKALIRPKIWRRLLQARKEIRLLLESALSDMPLSDYQKLIVWRYQQLNKSSLFFYFKFLAYSRYFSHARPRSVSCIDEYSPNNKLILEAARANGIKTVGIQHGSMHVLHPGYVYSKAESITNPFPDLTLVWGERWRQFLSESGHYPEKTLSITGQIRTDIIPGLRDIAQDKQRIFGDKINTQKIILFASQPQRDPKLRYRATKDVMLAAKQFPEATLVVKPHPIEGDFTYFENIASETGCENYVILKEVDLYLLLNSSDMVITCFSTVGNEAIYFHKPLIILDHLKQDVMHYVRDGVGIQVSDDHTLARCIRKILDGEIEVNSDRYQQYIHANAHKIDGNVCHRIEEAILG